MAILQVPITKAGKKLAVDTESIPQEMFDGIFAEGIKVYLNAKATKIHTKDLEGSDLEEAQAAAMEQAQKNLVAIYEGKFRKGRATGMVKDGKKVPGKVMTEAMRLARNTVKDALREADIRISHVEASEITRAARELVENNEDYVLQAEKNLEERASKPIAKDIAAMVKVSPKLVAKAEKVKADKKAERQLSAKQAGLPKTRVPPKRGSQPTA